MTQLSYEIVVPVLNEEKRLRRGVETISSFLARNGFNNCRIVIADNGSSDDTAKVAAQLCVEYPNAAYISVGQRGVGLALKSAWGQSMADVVGYMDVDLATDIEHFKEVVTIFEKGGVDVVNGSRNLPISRVSNRKMIREITSRGFNILLRRILNTHITDGMCGFKFTRRDVYQNIAEYGIRNDGWFFCTEFLCLAERLGFVITEIPVRWQDDDDSRVRIVRLSAYYLREIVRLRFRKLRKISNEK